MRIRVRPSVFFFYSHASITSKWRVGILLVWISKSSLALLLRHLKPSSEPRVVRSGILPFYECIMSFLQNENPRKIGNRKLFYGNLRNPSFGMQILFSLIIHISPFLCGAVSGKRVRNERCAWLVLKVEIGSRNALCRIFVGFSWNVGALLWI